MRGTLLALALSAVLFAPGCATVVQLLDGNKGPAMYGGTRSIIATFQDVAHGIKVQELSLVILALDWPLSLVADTLLFPWAAVNELVLEDDVKVRAFYEAWE